MKPTTALYAELQKAYDTFNKLLFNDDLPQCLMTLQREDRTYGYFSANRFGNRAGDKMHELALNPAYFAVVPLVEIMQTIVHEQCHLWQHHHGNPGRGRYHNKEWADTMESLGLMPSTTGRPGGARTGDRMGDYPIEGGRFLAACRKLLTDKFEIAWYDRFGHPKSLTALLDGSADKPAPTLDLPDEGTQVAALQGVDMISSPGKPANKSNRSKYTCACDISVWGRPGLRVACLNCEFAFSEEA